MRLDDFTKVIEDKIFLLNDLYNRYDRLENFLKDGNKFSSQCIDLRRRAGMIEDCESYIEGFAKNCKKVQSLENYLTFSPVHGKYRIIDSVEPKSKIEQLKKLEMDHLK